MQTRARNINYPDPSNPESTIQYHKDTEMLDLGYQNLLCINIISFPMLANIRALHVDHNKLHELPQPSAMPHITYISARSNFITHIPQYPNLTYLDVAENQLAIMPDLPSLTELDVSGNTGITLVKHDALCKLFASEIGCSIVDLDMYPNLTCADFQKNKIHQITGAGTKLLELSLDDNLVTELPVFHQLQHLFADNNNLHAIGVYDNIISMHVVSNKLVQIPDQPVLRQLYASHNEISNLGAMPMVEYIDVAHNLLQNIVVDAALHDVFVCDNPLQKVKLRSVGMISISFQHIGLLQDLADHITCVELASCNAKIAAALHAEYPFVRLRIAGVKRMDDFDAAVAATARAITAARPCDIGLRKTVLERVRHAYAANICASIYCH